jgi:hypothetical protein
VLLSRLRAVSRNYWWGNKLSPDKRTASADEGDETGRCRRQV